MKALIYRSPLDATLGLCGWCALLTAAGLCARKTTVRGWVALKRVGRREGEQGQVIFRGDGSTRASHRPHQQNERGIFKLGHGDRLLTPVSPIEITLL